MTTTTATEIQIITAATTITDVTAATATTTRTIPHPQPRNEAVSVGTRGFASLSGPLRDAALRTTGLEQLEASAGRTSQRMRRMGKSSGDSEKVDLLLKEVQTVKNQVEERKYCQYTS